MKILYVTDYAPNPGGAGSGLQDQMEAQRRLGNEVAVCTDHVPEYYQTFKPDVVHFHTVIVSVGLGALQWAQQRNVPHCLTLHDFWPFCGNRMMLRSIMDEQRGEPCPSCDGQCEGGRAHPWIGEVVNGSPVVVNQELQAARLTANGVRVNAVIHPSIDTEFWSPADVRPGEPRVLSTSAWGNCHWKGWALIERAFADTGVTVQRVGGIPRAALRDVLRAASIYLFPSSYPETWGLALMEAMACGCACIASAVDGPMVQIENGIDGLLVPPRDERALKEATLSLLADRGRARRLGQRAAEKVQSYGGLLRYGREHLAFYERLLDRKGG